MVKTKPSHPKAVEPPKKVTTLSLKKCKTTEETGKQSKAGIKTKERKDRRTRAKEEKLRE